MPIVTYGSICSGIEAATMAWQGLGWQAAYFSEIEAFPSAVLAHHYPNVSNWGDFTNIKHAKVSVDVLVGGTPCQAFSVAGLRESLKDERGNLTLQFVELIHATPNLKCAVWENVPGVLNTKDNAFGCFLGGLVGSDAALRSPDECGRWANSGMAAGPMGRVAWRVLNAQYFGIAQRRRRVFAIFSPTGSRIDCAKVLFECGGVRGDIKAGGKARKETSGYALTGIAKYSEGLGTLRAAGGDLGGGSEVLTLARATASGKQTFGTLQANVAEKQWLGNQEAHSGDYHVLEPVTYGLAGNTFGRQPHNGGNGIGHSEEIGYTLTKTDVHGVAYAGAVRKLTPVECERLQGFPDNYTNIKENCPDGPRYKALGNSMAVPVMAWIGARINQQIQEEDSPMIDTLLEINEDLVEQIELLQARESALEEELAEAKSDGDDERAKVKDCLASAMTAHDQLESIREELEMYIDRKYGLGVYLPDDLQRLVDAINHEI